MLAPPAMIKCAQEEDTQPNNLRTTMRTERRCVIHYDLGRCGAIESGAAAGFHLIAPGACARRPHLLSRSRGSVLYRHAFRSDFRAILAAQCRPLLRTSDRSSTPLVALYRCRVSSPRHCGARGGNAGAAVAGCIRDQLHGRVAERLWCAPLRGRSAVVWNIAQSIALYRHPRGGEPGAFRAWRRVRADSRWRGSFKLLDLLGALVRRQRASQPDDRSGVPHLVCQWNKLVKMDSFW